MEKYLKWQNYYLWSQSNKKVANRTPNTTDKTHELLGTWTLIRQFGGGQIVRLSFIHFSWLISCTITDNLDWSSSWVHEQQWRICNVGLVWRHLTQQCWMYGVTADLNQQLCPEWSWNTFFWGEKSGGKWWWIRIWRMFPWQQAHLCLHTIKQHHALLKKEHCSVEQEDRASPNTFW